uniref:Post-SET domain-containing protein n=1 Tax=Solanum tuberosum TaxID=4113 RepID=M1B3N6_SOLTU
MALQQLVAGSPLRTLCLLIAGQPADVFAVESTSQRCKCGSTACTGFVFITCYKQLVSLAYLLPFPP